MAYPQPFKSFPDIVQRSPNFIDLQVRDRPEVSATRLWGANNLTDAYGTWSGSGLTGTFGTNFATAEKGTSFVSSTWVQTQLVEESRRGMIRYYFNPDDFVVPVALPATPMPSDDTMLFVRLQESHVATGGYLQVAAGAALNKDNPIMGPILVIPPAGWWTVTRPGITLAGTAPTNTNCVVGQPPIFDETMQKAPPMVIELPRPGGFITIKNTAAGITLWVSAGLGIPMVGLAAQEQETFEGSIREIVVAGSAACTFSLLGTLSLET